MATASNDASFGKSSTNKDDLNEILTCGICLSRMSSPCCLPCAHSFCRSCLLDYATTNNGDSFRLTHYILCPYCKFRLNFRSLEHLQSLLIVNPILNQLCEMLSNPTFNQGAYRARCHTCSSMELLKICKHCSFMLCQTCRKTHLLDFHEQCKNQIERLQSNLQSIADKRRQMDGVAREYDQLREKIQVYTNGLIREIEQQRQQALLKIDEQKRTNEEVFWSKTGFESREKFEGFLSLLETGKRKLSAQTINDRDLIQLSDDLSTIPDIYQDTINSIDFPKLTLQFEQISPIKQLITLATN